MSSHKNMLELYVSERMKPTYKYSRPTVASGAFDFEKGDVKNPYFVIECVPSWARVLSPNGYRPIWTIDKGDFVISGSGKMTRVTQVFKRKYAGKIVKIKSSYNFNALFMTPEHPVYYRQDWNSKAEFLPAGKLLEQNGYLSMPCLSRDTRMLKNKETMVGKLDEDLVKIIGYYISEGHISVDNRNKKNYLYLVFTFGGDEDTYVNELVSLLEKRTKKKISVYKHKKENVIKVQVSDASLCHYLSSNFGKSSLEKSIPFYFKDLTDNLISILLKYLIRGDGNRSEAGIHYSSHSSRLLSDIRNMLLCIGIVSSISGSNCKENQLRIFNNNKNLELIKDNGFKYKYPFKITLKKKMHYLIEPGLWHKINTNSVEEESYNGTVYNIETESGDYVYENVIVHNCKDWNTASFSIKDDVWRGLKTQAAREMKDPVYIVENSKGNRLAIMDLEDWFDLIYEVIELRAHKRNAESS